MAYGKTEEEMKQVIDEAELAFWAVIAAKFPEVKTGDFPPEVALTFSEVCRRAVLNWLMFNYPNHRLSR